MQKLDFLRAPFPCFCQTGAISLNELVIPLFDADLDLGCAGEDGNDSREGVVSDQVYVLCVERCSKYIFEDAGGSGLVF